MDGKAPLLETRANELIARFYNTVFTGICFALSVVSWIIFPLSGFLILFFFGWRLLALMMIIWIPIVVDSWLKTVRLKRLSQSNRKAMEGFKNIFTPDERETVKPLLNHLESYLFRPNRAQARRLAEISEDVGSRLAKINSWSFYRDLKAHFTFRN